MSRHDRDEDGDPRAFRNANPSLDPTTIRSMSRHDHDGDGDPTATSSHFDQRNIKRSVLGKVDGKFWDRGELEETGSDETDEIDETAIAATPPPYAMHERDA